MTDNRMQPDEKNGSMSASRLQDAPRILIVENTQSTRELIGQELQGHYQIQTTATYEQALRHARTVQFDGILMGASLRGVDAGMKLIEAMRSLEGYSEVPIISIIGPSLPEAREQLADAGADDFLRMPFVRSELLDRLQTHVEST